MFAKLEAPKLEAPRLEALAVLVVFVVMIVINAVAGAGVFGKDLGTISRENPTYVTPDGLTFAIWGAIYAGEALLTLAQLCPTESVEKMMSAKCRVTGLSVRMRLVGAFLANTAWMPIFTKEQFILGLVVIVIYLAFLLSVYSDVNIANTTTLCDAVVVSTGIALNASWVTVATILNIFTVAGDRGGQDENGVAGSAPLAIVIVIAVGLLGLERATRGWDLAWAFVAGWAAWGIYRMQHFPDPEQFPVAALSKELATVALTSTIVIFLVIGVAFLLQLKLFCIKAKSRDSAEADGEILGRQGEVERGAA